MHKWILYLPCYGIASLSSCFTMGYTKQELVSLRNEFINKSNSFISTLKEHGIFKYNGPRGTRGGKCVKNKIFTIPTINTISDKHVKCTSSAANGAARSHITHKGQDGVNKSNLVNIKFIPKLSVPSTKLHFCHFNAQSARNKTAEIADYICEKQIDICAITESWLKESDVVKEKELAPNVCACLGFYLVPVTWSLSSII